MFQFQQLFLEKKTMVFKGIKYNARHILCKLALEETALACVVPSYKPYDITINRTFIIVYLLEWF